MIVNHEGMQDRIQCALTQSDLMFGGGRVVFGFWHTASKADSGTELQPWGLLLQKRTLQRRWVALDSVVTMGPKPDHLPNLV